MAVLVVGSETNFSELRARLFTGRVPAAALRRASAALAAANPHVDLDALVPGTVLTIPDVPEIPDRGALSLDASVHDGVDAIAKELTRSLSALRQEAETVARQARAERRETLATFDDDLVHRAAEGNESLAAALDAARTAIEEEERQTDDRLASLAQSIDGWSAEIEAMRTLTG